MRSPSKLSSIKTAQKESVIYRTVAPLLQEIFSTKAEFSSVYLNRAELTPGKTLCRLYLYSAEGEKVFQDALKHATLFMPSIRKAVAHALNSRYAPELLFVFDSQHAKVLHIESLIEQAREIDAQNPLPDDPTDVLR